MIEIEKAQRFIDNNTDEKAEVVEVEFDVTIGARITLEGGGIMMVYGELAADVINAEG